MKHVAWTYVSDSGIGYRGSVKHPDGPVYHVGDAAVPNENLDESEISEHELAHTSVFHWITAMGNDRAASLTDDVPKYEPSPRKYRSRKRRDLLIACYASLARDCLPPAVR